MNIKPKFKAGEEVFWIDIKNNDINKSYCELSRDIVEAVMIYEDCVTYWLASCDGEVLEDNIVEYDEKTKMSYQDIMNYDLVFNEDDNMYLHICGWNLYEKHLRGMIPEEEWDKLKEVLE